MGNRLHVLLVGGDSLLDELPIVGTSLHNEVLLGAASLLKLVEDELALSMLVNGIGKEIIHEEVAMCLLLITIGFALLGIESGG